MRRRAKRRTHAGPQQPTSSAGPSSSTARASGHASGRDPKSMVIRIGAGEVGTGVSQLAADVRKVMEPGTASRLRERRANRLKDYTVMAGPLGVTHLMLFSRSENGNTNLRVALAPRGPTLNFRVEQYSLCKDVQRAQRRPRGVGKEYLTPPLLVMNNFTTPNSTADSKVPRHLETLATTVFQSLFPTINPQRTPLKSIRRVLLLNRETDTEEADGSFIVNFRHYAITTRVAGVSRALRRLSAAERLITATAKTGGGGSNRKGVVPNLGRLEDIADFMIGGPAGDGYVTDGGMTSGSELDTDNEVEVLEPARRKIVSGRRDKDDGDGGAGGPAAGGFRVDEVDESVERRAVKMVELGPRMRLRLTKVEEELAGGRVMWHEYVHKTGEEVRSLDKRWEQRKKEKEARRREQRDNVERKRREREAQGQGRAGKGKRGEGDDGDEEEEDDDDDEYLSDGDEFEDADEDMAEGADDMKG